jgi:hypothetical protein
LNFSFSKNVCPKNIRKKGLLIMRLCYSILFVLFLSLTPLKIAAGPHLLNYQGQLTSQNNESLPNPVTITFAIYATSELGQPLWQEAQNITHNKGIFHTLLGTESPLPQNLFAEDNRYLEIRLANEPTFQPRQRIVSVAYAIQANNVTGHITPKSLTLGSTKIDTTGTISTSRITTDSLVIGQTGVINRLGQWTGPPLPVQIPGMILDTIIVRNFQDSLAFGSGIWADIDGSSDVLTLFINLKNATFLDIEFHTTVAATGEIIETRLALEPIDPRNSPIENISNVSRFIPRNTSDLGTLSNQAVVNLTPGLYRVFVQGRIEGLGTFQTGVLTVRAYRK